MTDISKLKFGQLSGIQKPQEVEQIGTSTSSKTNEEDQEKKALEVAKISEDAMQELQITDNDGKESFFDSIKKNLKGDI